MTSELAVDLIRVFGVVHDSAAASAVFMLCEIDVSCYRFCCYLSRLIWFGQILRVIVIVIGVVVIVFMTAYRTSERSIHNVESNALRR